jgi:deoxycytidylate deaminase
VLLNARGHVLATGYNGVAAGQKHCNEEVVRAATLQMQFGPDPVYRHLSIKRTHPHCLPWCHSASGTNLDGCQAIHAEQNALLQCRDVYAIHTCYVTASPCITCVKLLLNTSCEKIVFTEEYPHKAAQELWVQAGRVWQQFT